MGRQPSAVATLVERSSHYLLLVALPDEIKAQAVQPALRDAVHRVPAQLRRSLARDRGREMATHADLTAQTGCLVYFCDPKSPWQRGTNENTVSVAMAREVSPEVRQRTTEAFAIRVDDSLAPSDPIPIRTHDGQRLLTPSRATTTSEQN